MSHFAVKDFSHVGPASSRKGLPASFFYESEHRRQQQEDRLIAIGLLICFAVQLLVLVI